MDELPINWPMYAVAQNVIIFQELAKIRAFLEDEDANKIYNEMRERKDDLYDKLAVHEIRIDLKSGSLKG